MEILPIRPELFSELMSNVMTSHLDIDPYSLKLYTYLLHSMYRFGKFTFNHTDRFLSLQLMIHRNTILKSKDDLQKRGLLIYIVESHGTNYSINVGTLHVPTSESGTQDVPTFENVGTPDVPPQKNIGTRGVPISPMVEILESMKKNVGTRGVPHGTQDVPIIENVGTRGVPNYSSSSNNIYTTTKRKNSEISKEENVPVTNIEYLKTPDFLQILLETIPSEKDARAFIHSFYTKNKSRVYSDGSKMLEHFWNWLDKVLSNEDSKRKILNSYNNKINSENGIRFENLKTSLLKSSIPKSVVDSLRFKSFDGSELVISCVSESADFLELPEYIGIYKQSIQSNYGRIKLTYQIRKSK